MNRNAIQIASSILLLVLLIGIIITIITEGNSGVTHFYYDVTLYANDGSVIKEWKSSSKFWTYSSDGFLVFTDGDGKKIKVSGTVVVEELSR